MLPDKGRDEFEEISRGHVGKDLDLHGAIGRFLIGVTWSNTHF